MTLGFPEQGHVILESIWAMDGVWVIDCTDTVDDI